MEDKLREIFNVNYEIITPIHIGNGQSVPKTELGFFPEKKLIRKVDFDRFLEIQPPYKIKEISQKLRYAKNEFFNDILKSEKLALDSLSGEYDLKFLFDYRLDALSKLREISTHIKTPFFKPYLPGSSIKGWLRTAMLYYFIKKIKEIKSYVDEFYKRLDYLPQDTRKVKKEKGKIGKILEDEVFGKDPREDIFKFIIIRDTQSVSNDFLCLTLSQIFHPTRIREKFQFQSLQFSQYLEVLKINTKLSGKMIFNRNFKSYEKEFLQGNSLSVKIREFIINNFMRLSREELFQKIREMCNIFSKHILKFNIKYLIKLREEIDSNILQGLLNYYENTLYPTFEGIINSEDQLLIRLGGGTDWCSKTIGLFLIDYFLKDKNLNFNEFYEKINKLQLFKGQYFHKHFELIPISRMYIIDHTKTPQYPLGWIRVQLVE